MFYVSVALINLFGSGHCALVLAIGHTGARDRWHGHSRSFPDLGNAASSRLVQNMLSTKMLVRYISKLQHPSVWKLATSVSPGLLAVPRLSDLPEQQQTGHPCWGQAWAAVYQGMHNCHGEGSPIDSPTGRSNRYWKTY